MKHKFYRLFQNTEKILSKHPRLVFLFVIVISALLIISRRTQAIADPQFWAEDGKYWYSDAYNLGSIESLFITYGGYFVTAYRSVASLSLMLPFEHVPLFFNLCALGFQLLPLALINSDRLRHIIPYRSLAMVISFFYIAIPNSAEVFLNLTNIQWHLGLAAFLVLIAKETKKLVWKIFDIFVLIATGLAGPLVILLLPIAGFLWLKTKRVWQKRNLIIVGLLAEIQLLAIFVVSGFERVGGQPDANPVKFVKMISGQIFSGSILGEKEVNFFYTNTFLLFSIFTFVVTTILYVLKNGPTWLKLLNIYGVMLISSMLFSLRPTEGFDVWTGLTNPLGGQRYWYIPTLIWIATLFWILFKAKFKLLRYASAMLLLLILVIGIPRDWKLRPYANMQFRYYAERFESAEKGSTVDIPVNPEWHMYLYKR